MRQGQLQEEEERKRSLRQSLQLVRGEVQYNWGLIDRRDSPQDVHRAALKMGEWNDRYQRLTAEPGLVAVVRATEAAFEAFAHRRDFSKQDIEQRCVLAIRALDGAIESLEN